MSQNIYKKFYKDRKNFFNLPDYKITGGKSVKNRKILVVGVGTGRDVWYLANDNEVYGLDISKDAVSIAKKNGIRARLFDVSKPLPFDDSYFDIVVAKDVLEHLEAPEVLRDEIFRVLKKSGYAVISVPNHFYFPFRLRILLGGNLIWKTIGHDHTKLFEEWNYMHLRFFTWKGFQKFLDLGGFRIVKTFWDFGTLAHYNQPESVISYLFQKGANVLVVNLMSMFWSFFNMIFPKSLRSFIVSLSPSLLCAGFYVWAKKI